MKWLVEPMALVICGAMIWLFGTLSIAVDAAWLGVGIHFATSGETRGFLSYIFS